MKQSSPVGARISRPRDPVLLRGRGRFLDDIEARDARDQSRVAAPLKPAEDALRLDNSALGIDESIAAVQQWWQQRNPLDRVQDPTGG